MSDTEIKGLLIDLEVRQTKLERGLSKANKTQRRASDEMERRAKQSADRMSAAYGGVGDKMAASFAKLSKFAVPFAGGLLGGLAVGGINEGISAVQRLSTEIANVGNEARRAGVSAKSFQEWKFVAEQNRIGVDALVDGLKELNLRADEFAVTGKGSAAEAFQRLGFSAQDVAEKLKDPDAMLQEIFKRLEQLDKAAQIRIADELFGGTGGERFVELLEQGSQKIEATKNRASELGIVMSDDLIAKAERLNREFTTVSQTVGVALKSAIISAASSLSDFLDGFRSFQNQRDETLQARQGEIMKSKVALNDRLGKVILERDRKRIRQQMKDLNDEEDQIIAELQKRTPPSWKPKSDEWVAPSGSGAVVPDSGSGGSKNKGKSGASKAATDPFASTKQQIAELEAEGVALLAAAAAGSEYADAIELARKKAELLTAAQKAGKEITPELTDEIDQLAQKYVSAGNSAEDAAAKLKLIEDAGQRGAQTLSEMFTSILTGSQSAEQALSNLLLKLAEAQFNQVFAGLFGAGGAGAGAATWVGKLLSGGFASGGYTGHGDKFEPAGIVHRGEFVFSKATVQRLGAANLDRLHQSALRGYASGGLVGDTGKIAQAASAQSGASGKAPEINLASHVTVNASGGTPEANADLAEQVARQTEAAMRALIQQEMIQQMRPGGMMRTTR
ncbi:phage tail tape measure protein [Paenirhodobacter populi]|uniref:Phage tail tape measure protein domain-containing protein n=1 Tax=Paenirhodobacter populi TaxID=2306993 RepID=A0A443JKP5_9RHOB|nr:hypothetical protein D2T30_09805 [Sinirhodobacter populi]